MEIFSCCVLQLDQARIFKYYITVVLRQFLKTLTNKLWLTNVGVLESQQHHAEHDH